MRTILFLLSCLILFMNHVQAAPARLLYVKSKTSEDASQFIFTLSKQTKGRLSYQPDANQVTVWFDNAIKSFKKDKLFFSHANIHSLQFVNAGNNRIKIVIITRHHLKPKIKVFTAKGQVSTQVILDLNSLSHQKKLISSLAKPKEIKQEKQNHFTHNPEKILSSSSQAVQSDHVQTMQEKIDDLFSLLSSLKESSESKALKQANPVKQNVQNHQPRPLTIVIDPGHGGKDSGAIGSGGTKEKYVVLAISKYLANKINAEPLMRAVLTRHSDKFVPLRTRLILARRADADLFIAIHADAFLHNRARGASVYALSARGATSEAARWLAQKDNYSELDGLEMDALQDSSPLLRSVLIDMAQTATIQDSLKLGNKVLSSLSRISKLHYSHVEQAQFVVLKSPDIPSILVETGFITNRYEEKQLANPAYQRKIADAIFSGIKVYADYARLRI